MSYRQQPALATKVSEAEGAMIASQLAIVRDAPTATPVRGCELDLLQPIHAADAADSDTFLRLVDQRAALVRTLDALRDGLLVCDRRGGVVHANGALDALIQAEPERGRLYSKIRRVSEMLAANAAHASHVASNVCLTVETKSARYHVRGSYLAEEAFYRGIAILVSVEMETHLLPSDDAIRARFGLTRKEAAVARLIAAGKANAAIASALCISPHTARRHTEKIFEKLGVASRAEVGPRLLELTGRF